MTQDECSVCYVSQSEHVYEHGSQGHYLCEAESRDNKDVIACEVGEKEGGGQGLSRAAWRETNR